jgi:hypothetical protein
MLRGKAQGKSGLSWDQVPNKYRTSTEQVTEQVAAVLNAARVLHTREELQAMLDRGSE